MSGKLRSRLHEEMRYFNAAVVALDKADIRKRKSEKQQKKKK
jgi:hypothetical protein